MTDDEMYYDSASELSGSDEDEDMIDGTQGDNDSGEVTFLAVASVCPLRLPTIPDSSPDDGDISDDDYAFNAELSALKGKGKATPFHQVESKSLSVQDIESDMKKDAEYVAGIFGVSVRAPSVYLLPSNSVDSIRLNDVPHHIYIYITSSKVECSIPSFKAYAMEQG